MDDADDVARRHRAILARIARYPVTDPAIRASMLAEVEADYRRDLAARAGGLPTAAAAPAGEGRT